MSQAIETLQTMPVRFTINGQPWSGEVPVEEVLLETVRQRLGLTGTKRSCESEVCGACTVLIDGQPVKSCVTKVGSAAGKRIVTIEGIAPEGRLHPVQEAFIQADAMQCGWCTPGMVVGAVALLAKNPHPTDSEIVAGMNGHICRCGTYPRVVAAIRAASKKGGQA